MSTSTLPFTTLDVFSSVRYGGNPTACIPIAEDSLSQEQKQAIAKEFNLSEIVFIHEPRDSSVDVESYIHPGTDIKIDIFTVFAEVPFAGHPTIGTTNYILKYASKRYPHAQALITRAGRIPMVLTGPENQKIARISVPHDIHVHSKPIKATLAGPAPGPYEFAFVSIVKGMSAICAELPNLEALAAANQTGAIIKDIYKPGTWFDDGPHKVGLTLSYYFVDQGFDPIPEGTGESSPRRVIRSRMFGSREDPATGSAASAICAYLSLKDRFGLAEDGVENVFRYRLVQGVEMGRRSEIFIDVVRDADGVTVKEVLLSGDAVTVMRGVLEL